MAGNVSEEFEGDTFTVDAAPASSIAQNSGNAMGVLAMRDRQQLSAPARAFLELVEAGMVVRRLRG